MDELALMTVTDAAKATHLQPWRIYQLVETGDIPHVRVGNRVYFTRCGLRKWLGIEQSVVAQTSSN